MKIEFKEITVRELTNGYQDNNEGGVIGYVSDVGKLDIRPPYQREFIYKDEQRDAVIETITKNFPLNVMYWADREDGNFEVVDGQQRTISICQFVHGEFSYNGLYFDNLQDDKQNEILNYKLMVYQCTGTNSEKLEWFEIINIAGEELTDQELRNAVYSGSWVTDAKRYFSKNGCAAYGIGGKYLNGSTIRQDYLETTIKWISNGDIKGYMGQYQHQEDAAELWAYFQNIINWIEAAFPKYRREMKGVPWGDLYNEFKNQYLDPKKLDAEVSQLMKDDDIKNKKGIYSYVLTRKEKHLNIRAFTDNQKRVTYEKQNGICTICKNHFEIEEMEADHIKPWHEGGKTSDENCQMLCIEDNRTKGGR